jgi:hypothetical protein
MLANLNIAVIYSIILATENVGIPVNYCSIFIKLALGISLTRLMPI